jgi:hypothetical protein
MVKSTRDTTESRKPRPNVTGDPVMVRVQPDMAKQLDDWRGKQEDLPGRPEAIRRLVELGLTVKSKIRPPSEGQKLRAREMAGKAIDQMIDTAAHPDDQATRKRRLLKGPEEFRDVRVDRAKKK